MIEIDERRILITLNAWTTGEDFYEAAEQLYAQMMGWA